MSLEVDILHRQGAFTLEARFGVSGGVTALFGRSGSGKTTLVNAVGGLIRPDRARIAAGGRLLVDSEAGLFVPPHRRRIGTVFQEGRLFPHLSVRQNLMIGRLLTPRRARLAGGPELDQVVDLLGLAPLLGRRPAGLSGGEKQRVAIGRALLAHPRLLLMDEPLASLDEARKREILPALERLRDEVGVPIVYVSHSLAEVARLATTIVVLEAGRVAAVGPVTEVLGGRLGLVPLTGDPDGGTALDARVVAHDAAFGLTRLATPVGDLVVPRLAQPVGAPVRALVRARDVMLCLDRPHAISALNVLPGTVAEVGAGVGAGVGAWVEVRLACGRGGLLARVTRRSAAELGLAPGRPVHAVIKSVAFDAIGAEPGEAPSSEPP